FAEGDARVAVCGLRVLVAVKREAGWAEQCLAHVALFGVCGTQGEAAVGTGDSGGAGTRCPEHIFKTPRFENSAVTTHHHRYGARLLGLGRPTAPPSRRTPDPPRAPS